MDGLDVQKQIEHERKMETYFGEMNKIANLFPCAICHQKKYIIDETGINKACESECEYLRQYSKMVKEHKSLLVRVLGLV